MTYDELIWAVEEYGVKFPTQHFNQWWTGFLGLKPRGSGNRREYDERHVRLIVAWRLVNDICGNVGGRRGFIHRAAVNLLADQEQQGWVLISDNLVAWLKEPSATLFNKGAALIPVPEWHE